MGKFINSKKENVTTKGTKHTKGFHCFLRVLRVLVVKK